MSDTARQTIEQTLTSTRTVWVASALTLAIGLVFVFVWAPHPWGWRGIDQYHQLAVALARGEPFGTTDVPWAYAYYVAAFYAIFGEHAWLPVTVQVIANALVPVLLYRLAAPLAGRRAAILAALLTGVFSFNTVYASTQASDALCTISFLGSLLLLARAYRSGRLAWFAASGLVAGLAPQFRPNLILLPVVIAAAGLLLSRDRGRDAIRAAVYLSVVAVALAPWTIRNYRVTQSFLPTSTHGAVQLWYGTLQTGEYLESRAHNPRSVFEAPAFDYTSLPGHSIGVSATLAPCAPGRPASATLVYWTDRQPAPARISSESQRDLAFVFEIPAQPFPTTVYYAFETAWPAGANGGGHEIVPTPPGGTATPFVFFVSGDHLGDMDRHHDVLDVYDIVRLVRHLAWAVPLDRDADFDRNGTIDGHDLRFAIARLLGAGGQRSNVSVTPVMSGAVATLTFGDGSTFGVPQSFSRVTDLRIDGMLATELSYSRMPMWRLHSMDRQPAGHPCRPFEYVEVNQPYYRREPHMMRRYTALALDNIGRDPVAFLTASAYRAVRMFIIRGTSDERTTQQFRSSGLVYAAGTILSGLYLVLFLAGALIAWRRRSPAWLFLIPIVYVPATICFFLTNMRYTITVQPLMFVFVAIALLAALDRFMSDRPRRAR